FSGGSRAMKASSSVLFFALARISFGAPCAMTLPSSIAASQSNRLASSMYAVATSTLIQIDGHVDVIQIKNSQNALARGDHFPGWGEPILHAPAPRRDQHEIDQNRLQPRRDRRLLRGHPR